MGLADLHIHTIYGYAGTACVPAVLARARQIGLSVIAVSDHDEIKGGCRPSLWRPSPAPARVTVAYPQLI